MEQNELDKEYTKRINLALIYYCAEVLRNRLKCLQMGRFLVFYEQIELAITKLLLVFKRCNTEGLGEDVGHGALAGESTHFSDLNGGKTLNQ